MSSNNYAKIMYVILRNFADNNIGMDIASR